MLFQVDTHSLTFVGISMYTISHYVQIVLQNIILLCLTNWCYTVTQILANKIVITYIFYWYQ